MLQIKEESINQSINQQRRRRPSTTTTVAAVAAVAAAAVAITVVAITAVVAVVVAVVSVVVAGIEQGNGTRYTIDKTPSHVASPEDRRHRGGNEPHAEEQGDEWSLGSAQGATG